MARWLVRERRAPEAMPLLERAIQISPGYTLPRNLLSDLLYLSGNEVVLQTLVDSTLAVSPGDPAATSYARGAPPIAAAIVSPDAAYDRGVQLTGQDRHLEAAVLYRYAVQLSGRTPEETWVNAANTWNNLGFSLAMLGLFEAAIPPLENALVLQPDFTLASNNLAWAQGELTPR